MKDYQFPEPPLLMQKLSVYQVKKHRCYANWCGAGAGKTNSALIAARETNSRVTVIICPNSVKATWIASIKGTELKAGIYPNNSNVIDYSEISDIVEFDRNTYNYVIINYEKFSGSNKNLGVNMVNRLLTLNTIDFICIDEVQFAKARNDEESKRRACIAYFRMEAEKKNPNVYVYGMTATPVINSISEAKSLVELITGKEHPEIGSSTSLLQNCYQANKWLTIIGFRFKPNYGINLEDHFVDIDGSSIVEDLCKAKTPLDIEIAQIDLKLNNPDVVNALKPGTIVYCQYKRELVMKVMRKLDALNLTYVRYTGDEEECERTDNIDRFIAGKVDVLLATSPISTGVDGLQNASNCMVVLSYPWTGAEWEQLLSRINRRGSKFDKVIIVHPHVYVPVYDGGNDWSYDKRRWNIIENKMTLSDAVVDGKIEKIYAFNQKKFVDEVLNRLSEIKDFTPERNDIETNYTFTETAYTHAESIIKDIHRRAKSCKSTTMHRWFAENKNDWFDYHKQRELCKSQWYEDPVDVIAGYINARNEKQNKIADLGCGMAKLATIVKPEYKVISVDHVAKDDSVIACDIADLSEYIKDEYLDITVFCLSLWGTNYLDYIREAYRMTCKRGLMYVCEPKDKFDPDMLTKQFAEIGFDCLRIESKDKFNYFTFMKN